MSWIYGPVNSVEDIARINCIIRDEMVEVENEGMLTELKKRSDYLCTLSFSPFWQKKFGEAIDNIRKEALVQNRATVKLANMIAKVKGWNKKYSPWGKNKYEDIEENIRKEAERILGEIENSVYENHEDIEVDMRKLFCQIRFAMLYAEIPEDLLTLHKKAEMWVFTTFGKLFVLYFDKDLLEKLRSMTIAEFDKTVDLANVVAEFHGWDVEFDHFYGSGVEQEEDIEEYLQRWEEELKKASTYVPTEARYGDAKILWVVYELPRARRGRKKRAKRVYLPSSAKNVKVMGPDWFITRFGRKVWGIKIEYESILPKRTIKRGDSVITLPSTKVKRSKIVSLPEGITSFEITDKRPEGAIAAF